jgi:hypothetical protein
MLAEQVTEAGLGHARPARLRPLAHVDYALHARREELADQLGWEQALVADRPDRGHGRLLTLTGRRAAPQLYRARKCTL